ncbi:MAG: hypothetical protein ACREDY_20435 [Bradyrhizobium sp.]
MTNFTDALDASRAHAPAVTTLTPSERHILHYIARHSAGRMTLAIIASGGSEVRAFASLRKKGFIEINPEIGTGKPEHYRITAAGLAALGRKS